MDVSAVQQQAADVLLDRGVRVQLPAPLLYRLVGAREVSLTITRPKLGTLIAMSKLAAGMNVNLDELSGDAIGKSFRIVAEHGDSVAMFVAIAILNSKRGIDRKAKRLAHRLKWNLSTDRLAELFAVVILMSGVQDFLTTIKFVQQSNLMTRRTSLSQEESGSIEAGSKASIAPSDRSGA